MVPRHGGCFEVRVGTKGRRDRGKAARRRKALRAAAPAASTVVPLTKPSPPVVERPTRRTARAGSAGWESERIRWPFVWPIVGATAAALIGISVALALGGRGEEYARIASPTIDVGLPGGEVISQPTQTPRATPVPTFAPTPTAEPTPAPTSIATPAPTPTATLTPQLTPATTAPAMTATPEPTVIVAMGQPDDAVAAFYDRVAAGSFDAAYGLWSQRMRQTYARGENLDARFDDTTGIAFEQLYVAEQVGDRATVQANFVETYESGATRRFVGYWRLVLVEGQWLLDEPHY